MAIDLQPATNPLDIPPPKPSAIVRHWPDAMSGKHAMKICLHSGEVRYCAAGIICETGGYDWGEPDDIGSDGSRKWGHIPDSRSARWLAAHLGISLQKTVSIMGENDFCGKESAASLLESWGR